MRFLMRKSRCKHIVGYVDPTCCDDGVYLETKKISEEKEGDYECHYSFNWIDFEHCPKCGEKLSEKE